MSSYYLWVAHEHEQLLLISCAWACAVITEELRMSMSTYYSWVTHEHKQLLSSYYWWVGHEHEQLFHFSNALACAVITFMSCAWECAVLNYELPMSISSYYLQVTLDHEHLLLMSCAWACAVISYEFCISMSSYYSYNCSWAWAVITNHLRMSMSTYYSQVTHKHSSYCLWVAHEHVQLLLFTNA